jgi:AhpC/TSA family
MLDALTMRKLASVTGLVLLFLGSTWPLQAQSATDLEGKSVDPLSVASGKIVVLVFVRRDCPVSGRYAPVIQKISAEHARDARFWLVYPDKADEPGAIRNYLVEYGYSLPALRDPHQVLVKSARVQITPEVAVFDRDHHLVYDGRIDNWYVDATRSRPAPTTHELEDAIRAATEGKPVAQREVRGVGCYIADLQ